MSEAVSLHACKPEIQGDAPVSRYGRVFSLGVSCLLHVSVIACFLGGFIGMNSISQSTSSVTAIPVSIISLAGNPAPVPEKMQKQQNVRETAQGDVPSLKAEEHKKEKPVQPKERIETSSVPGEKKVSARQQGDFATSGTDTGKTAYHDELRAWLEKHKTYPRRARLSGMEGVVTIDFIMTQDGQVISSHIVKSSGHELLDRAALDAIEEAAPLPKFPPELKKTRLALSIPFSFFLN